MPRLTLGAPAFLFGLFDLCCAGRPPFIVAAVLGLSFALQLVLLQYWFAGAAFLA
jgi:hypothetical protein